MTLTPDQITRIRQIAASGDPFMQGAVWMLDQITEPSPTAGVISCPKETPDAR